MSLRSATLILLSCLTVPVLAQSDDVGSGDAPGRLSVVALVNGDPVTRYELEKQVTKQIQEMETRGAPAEMLRQQRNEIRKQILRQMIMDRLLIQRCDEQKIDANDEDIGRWVDFQVVQLREQGAGIRNAQDYYRMLADETGDTEEEIKESLRREIRIQRLYFTHVFKDDYIGPDELRAHYRENQEDFTSSSEYVFLHILVPKAEPLVEDLLKELQGEIAAGAPFPELVKKYSQGPRKDLEGRYRQNKKQASSWLPSLAASILALDKGEVSPLVETRTAFHYIYMEDRVVGEQLSFEDAQEDIQKSLKKKRRRLQKAKFEKELIERAAIKNYLDQDD